MARLGSPFIGLALLAMTSLAASAAGVTVQGFYEESSGTTWTNFNPATPGACTHGFSCFYAFARVRAGKQLVVTQTSCNLDWDTDVDPTLAEVLRLDLLVLNGTSLGITDQHLIPPKLGDGTVTSGKFIFNASGVQVYRENERPIIWINTKSNTSFSGGCTIAGQIFDVAP
jgi:hypothetical protein